MILVITKYLINQKTSRGKRKWNIEQVIQIKINSKLVGINLNISEIALYISELKTSIIKPRFSDWF